MAFLPACPPWLHFANSLLHVWNKAGSTQRRPLMPQSRRTAKSRSELRLQSNPKPGFVGGREGWTEPPGFRGMERLLFYMRLWHSRWWFSNCMEKQQPQVIFFTKNIDESSTLLLHLKLPSLYFPPSVTSFASLRTPAPHSKDGNQSYSFAGDKGWFPQWKDLFCWCFHSSSCWLGLRCPTGDHVQNQMFNQPSVLKRYRLFVNVEDAIQILKHFPITQGMSGRQQHVLKTRMHRNCRNVIRKWRGKLNHRFQHETYSGLKMNW